MVLVCVTPFVTLPLLLLLALLTLLAHRGARAAPFSATRAREFRGHGRPAFDVFEAAARPEGAAESLISPCPAAPPRPVLGGISVNAPRGTISAARLRGQSGETMAHRDFVARLLTTISTIKYLEF